MRIHVRRTRAAGWAVASLLALTAGLARPVEAQDAGISAVRQAAWDVVAGRMAEEFTADQLATINLIGHAAAAAGLCPGLELDEAAVLGDLAAMAHTDFGQLTVRESETMKDYLLIAFGAVTGLMVAEGAADPGFCDAARALAADPAERPFLRVVTVP